MAEDDGVTKMYSRLDFLTNEIAGFGSTEMSDHLIVKKKLRALTPKYDTVCTILQTMPSQARSLDG